MLLPVLFGVIHMRDNIQKQWFPKHVTSCAVWSDIYMMDNIQKPSSHKFYPVYLEN